MDLPPQAAASGMLSLHVEAEGGIEGRDLFLGEPSQSGHKSGDAASISGEDATEKKKKNKKRRRAERAAAEAAKKQEAAEETQKKCTGYCGKRKALSQFNADQNSCKECVLHQKAFWRHAHSQGCTKDMKDLEKSDPKMAADVQKEFAKERMQAAATEKKLKFGIQAFRKTLESRSGERADKVKKMMWEGEWMEESKRAKYGYLGKEEAQLKWNQWMSDPDVAKDQEGPRGFTRVAIPHKTLLSGFNEVATKKEFTQEERLSRNATDATLAARARMVVTESTNAEEEAVGGVKLADIKKQAVQHGVDMAEMYAASVPEAMEAAQKKRRLSGKTKGDKATEGDGDQEKESGDESQASSQASEADGPAAAAKPKAAKWFDAETKCRKAERTWVTGLDDLANSVQIVLQQVAETLNEFRARGAPAAAKFAEEMLILEKRQKWASAILEAEDASLIRLVADQQAEESAACVDSQTTSQDVAALGRVGPCKDYQELQTLATLKQMAAEFRTCTSAQQIKEVTEKGASRKKPINTLLQAVKAAKADLIAAEKRAQAQNKREEDRAAKEAAKAAKAGAASGSAAEGETNRASAKSEVNRKKQSTQSILLDNNSELWQDDTFRIPVLRQEELDPDLCNEPFIQSGVNLPQEVSAAVAEFGRVFSASTLRVTDGRAQTPLDDQGASLLIKALTNEEKVPSFWSVEALSEAAGSRDTLVNIQKASRFGFAACSVSSGRTEIAMMPCFRIVLTGNMMVAVLTPRCSEDPKKMVEDMTGGNAEVLMKRAREKELSVATLGPGDMLFLPPVCAMSHRVHAHDVLGIRVGAYSRKFQERMEKATANKADNTAIPPNILSVLRSAMEEYAEPQYSEVMMQTAAENRAEQRDAAQQSAVVPAEAKEPDQTGKKKDSQEASAPATMQNEDKESSGQNPQQEDQTDKETKTTPDSGNQDDANHESPGEKDAKATAATSNLDPNKKVTLEPRDKVVAAPAQEPPKPKKNKLLKKRREARPKQRCRLNR